MSEFSRMQVEIFRLVNNETLRDAVRSVYRDVPLSEDQKYILARWLSAYGRLIVYAVPWDQDQLGMSQQLDRRHVVVVSAAVSAWLTEIKDFLEPEPEVKTSFFASRLSGIDRDIRGLLGKYDGPIGWDPEIEATAGVALDEHENASYAVAGLRYIVDTVADRSAVDHSLRPLLTAFADALHQLGEALREKAPQSSSEPWLQHGIISFLTLEEHGSSWSAYQEYRPWWFELDVIAKWRKMLPRVTVTGIGWGMLPPSHEKIDPEEQSASDEG